MAEIEETTKPFLSRVNYTRAIKSICFYGIPAAMIIVQCYFPSVFLETKSLKTFLSFELFALLAVMLTVSLAALVNFELQLSRLISSANWNEGEAARLNKILSLADKKGRILIVYFVVVSLMIFFHDLLPLTRLKGAPSLVNLTLTFWFFWRSIDLFWSQLIVVKIQMLVTGKENNQEDENDVTKEE